MGISRFFATTRRTARFSLKLCVGICLLSGVPAMAQTVSQVEAPVLMAQSLSLSQGDRGRAVLELQRRLDQRGLFPAKKDGIYGPETTQAVRQFQRIRRLEETGIANIRTLELLGIDVYNLPAGLSHPIYGTISGETVNFVSSPGDVRVLQSVLRFFDFEVAVDGIYVYEGETWQAVRAYQRTAQLPVTGVADRATLLDMGFGSGNAAVSSPNLSIGGSEANGRYIAAVIAGPSELRRVQRLISPNAEVQRNRVGDYISLGRFRERSDAAAWVDLAREYDYEAQVLWD